MLIAVGSGLVSRMQTTPFLPLSEPHFNPSCAPTVKGNFLAIHMNILKRPHQMQFPGNPTPGRVSRTALPDRIRACRNLRRAGRWHADPHTAFRSGPGDQRPGSLWRAPWQSGHLPDPDHWQPPDPLHRERPAGYPPHRPSEGDHHRPRARKRGSPCRDLSGGERPRQGRAQADIRRRRQIRPDSADGLEPLVYPLSFHHRRQNPRGRRNHGGQRHGRCRVFVCQHRRLLDAHRPRICPAKHRQEPKDSKHRTRPRCGGGRGARRRRPDPSEQELPRHAGIDRFHPCTGPEGRHLLLARPAHLPAVRGQLRPRGDRCEDLRGLGLRPAEIRLVQIRRGLQCPAARAEEPMPPNRHPTA